METHSSKSSRKRPREQEDRPCAQRKSQRLLDELQSSSSTSSDKQDESDEPMKITGLNDDCLLKIFAHLDWISLVDVAIANERLRPVANVVYKRKFGLEKVCISNDRYILLAAPSQINGLRKSLQFLRCLGSSINGLTICYSNWNEKQCKYIHQYVNKYCAENLVEIGFRSKLISHSIKQFERPFVNVRTVEVFHSDLHNLWTSFAEWFPHMRSLRMKRVYKSNPIDLSKLNHLEEVSIDVSNVVCDFTADQATRLLQPLPHLQRLDIAMPKRSLNSLLKIIENNRAIRKLKVSLLEYVGATATVSDIQQLINDHPMLIELELMGLRFTLDTLIPIMPLISQLNALKLFRFQVGNYLEYDGLVAQLAQLDGQWRSTHTIDEKFIQLER